jgi:hypothetical protein
MYFDIITAQKEASTLLRIDFGSRGIFRWKFTEVWRNTGDLYVPETTAVK